ncbi:hypothetical protein BVRB_5g107870 [Beta vulgaris subsp. vulgaris]|nr:hypothetical protein BVRB_5g107870 [Beta vulgaris subsp. vulgaris]
MRELEALQDDQNSESHKDSFDEVMGNAPSSKRLHGLGVSHKMQKDKELSTSLILPEEVIDSIKKAVTADVQKDLITQREEFKKEREAHAA